MSADADLIARYLDHLRHEKRLADNSLKAYAAALRLLGDSAAQAGTPLPRVRHAQIRSWVTRMRTAGRSHRGAGGTGGAGCWLMRAPHQGEGRRPA